MVQYYWTEPPWFRIFRHQTFCGLALPVRTIQGSVWSDRTFLLHHFWRKNILWFSIIGQNLFGSEFLANLLWFRIIEQNHARLSITRQNLFGSAFLDRVRFMIQYYWTKPFRFNIFRQATFCGSALRGEPFMVQHYRIKPFMVQDYRLEPFRIQYYYKEL